MIKFRPGDTSLTVYGKNKVTYIRDVAPYNRTPQINEINEETEFDISSSNDTKIKKSNKNGNIQPNSISEK